MGTQHGADPEAGKNASLRNNVRRHNCCFWSPDLDQAKYDQEHKCHCQQCDYSSIAPLFASQYIFRGNGKAILAYAVGESAPLERQAKTDDTWKQDYHTFQIQLPNIVFPITRLAAGTWNLE